MKKSELREKAFDKLGIDQDRKLILSLDSGGVRNLIALQVLKKIEEIIRIPCYELFDLVSGAGTGSLLALLLASGQTAQESEAMYIEMIKKLYIKDNLLADRFLNPPLYDKRSFRSHLKNIFKETTLQETVTRNYIDFITCFVDASSSKIESIGVYHSMEDEAFGSYKLSLMRNIAEASISAPILFSAYERYFDASSFISTNISLQALLEARKNAPEGKYSDKVTIFNIGSGTRHLSYQPKQLINPEGIDAAFYLNYLQRQSPAQSSNMQIDLMRSNQIKDLEFRRFNFSLHTEILHSFENKKLEKLTNISSNWLWDVPTKVLDGLDSDSLDMIDFATVLGNSFADYIVKSGNGFKSDMVDELGNDVLIKDFSDETRTINQLADVKFSDGLKS